MKYTNKEFDRADPSVPLPSLRVLAEKIRQQHREMMFAWMNTLEEATWIEPTSAEPMTDPN